jgi:hypothetical protein
MAEEERVSVEIERGQFAALRTPVDTVRTVLLVLAVLVCVPMLGMLGYLIHLSERAAKTSEQAAEEAARIPQWEYKLEFYRDGAHLEDQLNASGVQGWEAIEFRRVHEGATLGPNDSWGTEVIYRRRRPKPESVHLTGT